MEGAAGHPEVVDLSRSSRLLDQGDDVFGKSNRRRIGSRCDLKGEPPIFAGLLDFLADSFGRLLNSL